MKIFSSHYQDGYLHSSVTVIYHLHHTTPTSQDCHQHWRFSFIFGCESSPTSCHVRQLVAKNGKVKVREGKEKVTNEKQISQPQTFKAG